MDVIMMNECTCHMYTLYLHVHIRVHIHIIPPISPPQVDYGPAESYCCSAGKPNRGQTWGG